MHERRKGWRAVLLGALLAATASAVAGGEQERPVDFTSFSLEELMETEITSVSRKAERLRDVPAAVYVITAEDIRRSGATCLAEVLRMVPGLEVARSGSHTWEISARGFRYRTANKFLVLIDGRAVYAPVFGTVLWEDQDLVLEDIARIEVIRGPGATVWGTNAVNGVINVITKAAGETPGTLVRFSVGNEETIEALWRRGGTFSRGAWRVSAKAFRRDDLVQEDGRPSADRWGGSLLSFRVDWTGRRGDEWMVAGHVQAQHRRFPEHRVRLSWPYNADHERSADSTMASLLLGWRRRDRAGGTWSARGWIDGGRGTSSSLVSRRTTVDGLVEYVGPRLRHHQWSWGIGARNIDFDARGHWDTMEFRPHEHSDQLWNAWIQDEIAPGSGAFRVVAGTKFEYTSASGLEMQPQVRVRWRWSPGWMAWGALARAARIPSLAERYSDSAIHGFAVPRPDGTVLPAFLRLRGSTDHGAEHLVAREAGLRWTPRPSFIVDLSVYRNRYSGVTTYIFGQPELAARPAPHLVFPLTLANRMRIRFEGAELLIRWRSPRGILLEGWWSWMQGKLLDQQGGEANRQAIADFLYFGVNPRHQLHARTSIDFRGGWEIDGSVHWTGRLETGPVASWTRVDLRVGWHSPSRDREWSIALRNLLGRHQEFRYVLDTVELGTAWTEPALVSRWTWRF